MPADIPRVRRVIAIVATLPLIAVGCAGVHSAGLPTAGVVRSTSDRPPSYTVGCPDVLAVRFADTPHLDCLAAVDLDGRLPISESVQAHVEGGTLDHARQSIAAAVGCDPARVLVELVEARTGRLYLFGPEQNRQRVVSYTGAERLVDFLYRTESLRPGCSDLGDVCVLRPNVAAGSAPQVFRANLRAVQHGDHTTNVILEPGDQIYVGETRRSSFARLLPDWLKPGYRRMAGVSASDTDGPRR